MSTNNAGTEQPGAKPWWRFPLMWMVVGGPAVVVVASFVTLSLALRYPEVLVEDRAQVAGEHTVKDAAQQPAVKARNNAATGGQ